MLHSALYKTCLEAPLPKYVYLMLKAAIFDGFSITALYFTTFLIFKSQNPFLNYPQLIAFVATALLFAYGWEAYSLQKKKWQYADTMPILFGVGVTPLVQLALTGVYSLYIAFYF